MLLSAKRTIIATSALASCVLLVSLNRLLNQYLAAQMIRPTASVSNISTTAFGGVNPYWTTEHEKPRFAYVQYATDFDYLCNAVGITADGQDFTS
jgi:hypothetical protein